ncbi:hypothetical protein LWM68_45480 [Niabella sp. W65]|nr:hypothetical protein [Niabella sp. W65]MCH7369353.1 hypothetical protein [Niabella sp. W65]
MRNRLRLLLKRIADIGNDIRDIDGELTRGRMPGDFVVMPFYNMGQGGGAQVPAFTQQLFMMFKRQVVEMLYLLLLQPLLGIADGK